MLRRTFLAASAFALAACSMDMADDAPEADVTPAAASAEQNIVETAMAADNLTTLVAAIQAAGLADTLASPGPFTVFAPTDEAFAALPPGVLDQLLLPRNQQRLQGLLAYHTAPGRLTSGEIAGRTGSVQSVQGAPIQIDASQGGVRVNNANVIAADIQASNGVIHLIDRVIVPATPPTN